MKGKSALLLALFLAGCAGVPRAPRPAEVYDLGPGRAASMESGLVGVVQIQAPSWLRSAAMQYRLSYVSANQRNSYLESRWAASPAELLLGLLNRSLKAAGRCRLEVDLDEFIQDYASASQSDGVIEARARLRGDGMLLSSRRFSLRLPAPSPDAQGGVAALTRGSLQLTAEMSGWLSGLEREARITDACAPR